jgi:cytochrome c-type biogenesis protein CcmH/NrfF
MKRKPPKGKSLAEVNPALAKEWYQKKNNFTPFNITAGSDKKVWWKCEKGTDHIWLASVGNRHRLKRGCPVCSNQLIVKSNSLTTTNPELALEWHSTKNGDLNPDMVGAGSTKKVWWQCQKKQSHIWKASVRDRKKTSCPYCANKKVSESNSLASTHPDLADEWDYKENFPLTPNEVTAGSNKKVWWKCNKGDDHKWQAVIYSRKNGNGCPICSNNIVVDSNCLEFTHPKLSLEWHPTRNAPLTPREVNAGSSQLVWWKCMKGEDHVWKASLVSRKNGANCRVCSNEIIVKSNALVTTHSHIAKEWDYKKNSPLTPDQISFGNGRKVWWKCPKGDDHKWQATTNSRTYNNLGCPICSGKKVVVSNCLATTNSDLSKQWHPSLNGKLTPYDVTFGHGGSVWWQCEKNETHVWKTSPNMRTSIGNNCPFCTLTPQSRQELQITFELKQFFKIDPKGFKTRINNKIWSIDIYIKELNLGIEFDGSYWHKGKRELDKLKTEKLEGKGFTIMRIRQHPLKPITEIDVISENPFNAKKVTDNILKHIINTYEIETELKGEIEKYYKKRKVQNEEALNEYINVILLEKAERKKIKKKRTTTTPKLH